MLVESDAIVLYKIKYDDKNLIVHLYSRDFGRMSYIAACHKKRGSLGNAFFEPLSLINYQAEHKESRELQRLRESHSYYAFRSIPFDPVKNSIALFLSEVLYRVLQEAEPNEALFGFLSESIQLLDAMDDGKANFHLIFLSQLSRHLGIMPNLEDDKPDWYFDLMAGCFVPFPPNHPYWMNQQESADFVLLQQLRFEQAASCRFSRFQRRKLLDTLLDYYRLHLNDFPVIKSLDIMQELFEG